MKRTDKHDYGKCHVCGEQMKEKRINHDFWLKGKLIVIESVPAGVCPQCGEKIVKADVGRQLATLIQKLKHLPKQKTMTVPVVRYESLFAKVASLSPADRLELIGAVWDTIPSIICTPEELEE